MNYAMYSSLSLSLSVVWCVFAFYFVVVVAAYFIISTVALLYIIYVVLLLSLCFCVGVKLPKTGKPTKDLENLRKI